MPVIGQKIIIRTDEEYNNLMCQKIRTNTAIYGWDTWEIFPTYRVMVFTQY